MDERCADAEQPFPKTNTLLNRIRPRQAVTPRCSDVRSMEFEAQLLRCQPIAPSSRHNSPPLQPCLLVVKVYICRLVYSSDMLDNSLASSNRSSKHTNIFHRQRNTHNNQQCLKSSPHTTALAKPSSPPKCPKSNTTYHCPSEECVSSTPPTQYQPVLAPKQTSTNTATPAPQDYQEA